MSTADHSIPTQELDGGAGGGGTRQTLRHTGKLLSVKPESILFLGGTEGRHTDRRLSDRYVQTRGDRSAQNSASQQALPSYTFPNLRTHRQGLVGSNTAKTNRVPDMSL